MSKFHEVLKNRNFFLLWLGQIISQLGDRLSQMALIGFMYSSSRSSTLEIAKLLSFTIIPVFVIGPIAGAYVDRWDRRRTMYICDLLRAILIFTIPFFLFSFKSLVPMYLIVFVIFSIGRFFVPAKLSIIPDMVDAKDLLMANSLINTTGMIAAVLGFGISGIIVELLKAKAGFYLDSLSFLVSGILIFLITKKSNASISFKRVSKEIVEVIRKSVFQEIREGILYFIKQKQIRLAAGVIFTLWAALGAIYVVIIVFIQKTLHSATKDLGLLIMFLGIGLFLGSMVYGRFGQRFPHYKTIFVSLVLSGIMLLVFALIISQYPYFLIAAALSFFLGVLISPIMISSNTIIHSASDNGMMGKTFSSLEIIMHLGFLIFMFTSGKLAEKIPEAMILVIVGCAVGLLGIVNLIWYRKIQWLN